MIQDVFIVEAPTTLGEAKLAQLLSPNREFRWIGCDWQRLPGNISSESRQLLVAVAVPDATIAIQGLRRLWRASAPVLILAVMPMDSSPELVHSLRVLAHDLIFWPVREQEFLQRLRSLLAAPDREAELARKKLTQEFALRRMVGSAPAFARLLEQISRFGPTEAPVLLTGETGTGKELCARAIHMLSPRHQGPFIPVDCGAVPEHLAESELFGHVRGAFTDAHRDHNGLASLAEGGTLFLDEIDALSLPTQGKLLRFIQEGIYRRLGGERFARANVRVVAASNCDLERMVSAKQFRSDLYFRLNVLRILLPPLRERRGDIRLLALHFLEQFSNSPKLVQELLAPACLQKLQSYHWPGNVRELLNVLQRAVVLSAGEPIQPEHILFTAGADSTSEVVSAETYRTARSQAIERFERHYVSEMLQKHNGNITHAARDAGHDRRGFGRLAKKYHLDVYGT
jgi:two-component system, NtrC family, response regulator GlrR